MYRSSDDSVFSCFSSNSSCKKFSRAGSQRCRKTAEDITTRGQASRTSSRFQSLASDLSHREKQIRSEICFLSRDHRFLLQPSSPNRYPTDQLRGLFQGRRKQARAEYKPLPGGNYFTSYLLTSEGPHSRHRTNLYHSVVAFSTLFFTLLLIISSISTSMTVQGVAGDARKTNKSQPSPSLHDSNAMQPSGISFRPQESGESQRQGTSSVRTLRNLFKIGPIYRQTITSSSSPQKLSKDYIFKYGRKRSSLPGRMTMYNYREKWLEISTGDKFSIKSLEEKHRFLRFLNISNETKLTLFIPAEKIDLKLSNVTRDVSPIMSALVRPTNRKKVIRGRADHSSSSWNRRVNINSDDNNNILVASFHEHLVNNTRFRTRYRKDVESTRTKTMEDDEEERHSKTKMVDDVSNETARTLQQRYLHWDVDDPDMLEEECFTEPFLPLNSNLHFHLEHSSTECLENETPPEKIKSPDSAFERYVRSQRETALEICQSYDHRRDDKESFYLPFCDHLRVTDALQNQGKDCFTADPEHRYGDDVCPSCLERLLKFDQNAKSIHCLFEIAVSYYNCEDMYSKTARCDQCKAAHKLWICSLLIPYFSNETRIPACPHYEQIVENRCPYLSPHNNNQYAGEAMFQSKNDRASINEVLMMKEDVRPTCHYPCLIDEESGGRIYDQGDPYPVDDSSRDEVKSSSTQRLSVCLSHELDTAPDWSFDREDALLLDLLLEPRRVKDT